MSTTTELAPVRRVNGDGGELASPMEFDRAKVDLLKRTICNGASDDELELFIHACKRTGLDPFMRQIHAVKRWDSDKRCHVMAIQTGIDGYRLIADRTGRYMPGREPSFEYDGNGGVLSATAYVKKQARDGSWHEVSATAHYTEYVGTTKDGSPNRMWREKPHIMLAKCAESQALRRAFPAEMSGVYTAEEMPPVDAEQPAPKPRKSDPPPANKPVTPEDEKFLADWTAAIGSRGFGEDAAGKLLCNLLDSRRKTLNQIDALARQRLLEMAKGGHYDAWLRPPAPKQPETNAGDAEPPAGPHAEQEPAPAPNDAPPVDVVREAMEQDEYPLTLVNALKTHNGVSQDLAMKAVNGFVKLNSPSSDARDVPLDKRVSLFKAIESSTAQVSKTGVLRWD